MMEDFLGHELEEWYPMPPDMGPPLPRWMGIYWPWYKAEIPPTVYTCPYCGAEFATEEELQAHIRDEHPEMPVADIRISDLVIEPTEGYIRVPVYIAVVATNYGTAAGSRTITCTVTETTEKTVYLNPGESKTVDFDFMPLEAKTYYISVDGLTGTFEAILGLFSIGIGIYDETVPKYVAGTIRINGQEWDISADRYEIIELQTGIYSFGLPKIPANYEFIRWGIYDWQTGELVKEVTTLPMTLSIPVTGNVNDVFIRAMVTPIEAPPETGTLYGTIHSSAVGLPLITQRVDIELIRAGISHYYYATGGSYSISNLHPGVYTVVFSALGYKPYPEDRKYWSVAVYAGKETRLNPILIPI